MISTQAPALFAISIAVCAVSIGAQEPVQSAAARPLSADAVTPINAQTDDVVYRGRQAVHVIETESRDRNAGGGHSLGLVKSDFTAGTIEIMVAGAPRAGADTALRGFVGVAFHVAPDAQRFRAFYLRPTNGRSHDQLRRNHSTQYIAAPDFPWHRLRREEPGVYESYVDLESGAWTRLRIVVSAGRAMLYVHDSDHPVLIVNDMKPGSSSGQIALWIGQGTDAYFADLRVTPAP